MPHGHIDKLTIKNVSEIDEIDWNKEMEVINNENKKSILEKSSDSEYRSFIPNLRPAFNLAAYINKSYTLKQLLNLGVDLNKLEKRKGIAQYILKLDFEKDIKNHITCLHDLGISSDELAQFITKNPLIFKETFDDIETRVNYLQSKNFTKDQITRIINKNPYWLSFSTTRIDRRLGYFQHTFKLKGNEIRNLTILQPRLITYNMEHIRTNSFSICDETGFSKEEVKELLLSKPKLWMISKFFSY